ncbi:hypothetical protein [Microbacterium sp. 179-I 3D3 NHS]|uniref:hypothetical protein n=1 Tax=Microbacterium sp. 179-I 3D3 NHS TaxID=3142382 RepID=UPI0039A05D22
MNHHPNTTPEYVISAIPGATELASEYTALRVAHSNKASAARAASETARDLTTPHVLDPLRQPKPGVSHADWTNAIDAYRVATDELSASDRDLDRAVRKFSHHVDRGRRTEAFKAQYAVIGKAAQKDAAEKLTALRAAIMTRDEVNAWLGRQVQDPTSNGVRYTLREIASYVDAVPDGRSFFREKALSLLAQEILLPGDRETRVRVINDLDVRDDIDDAQKLAEYRARIQSKPTR